MFGLSPIRPVFLMSTYAPSIVTTKSLKLTLNTLQEIEQGMVDVHPLILRVYENLSKMSVALTWSTNLWYANARVFLASASFRSIEF